MKKRIHRTKPLLICLSAFVIIILFCKCLQPNTQVKTSVIAEWPNNTYTSQVPKPHFGQPSRLIEFINGCGILLDDCSEENLISYVVVLHNSGYATLNIAESDDSKVFLLSNGSLFVQLTLSEKSLLVGLYITMPEPT